MKINIWQKKIHFKFKQIIPIEGSLIGLDTDSSTFNITDDKKQIPYKLVYVQIGLFLISLVVLTILILHVVYKLANLQSYSSETDVSELSIC